MVGEAKGTADRAKIARARYGEKAVEVASSSDYVMFSLK